MSLLKQPQSLWLFMPIIFASCVSKPADNLQQRSASPEITFGQAPPPVIEGVNTGPDTTPNVPIDPKAPKPPKFTPEDAKRLWDEQSTFRASSPPVPGTGTNALNIRKGTGIYTAHNYLAATNVELPAPSAGHPYKGHYLYAPTTLASSQSCLEVLSAYWRLIGQPGTTREFWVWDHCLAKNRVKIKTLNNIFSDNYVNGSPADGSLQYFTAVKKIDGDIWAAYLWNFKLGFWETLYTVPANPYEGYAYGWTMFETYFNDECPFSIPAITAKSFLLFDGGKWQPLNDSNTTRDFHIRDCNEYGFYMSFSKDMSGNYISWTVDDR